MIDVHSFKILTSVVLISRIFFQSKLIDGADMPACVKMERCRLNPNNKIPYCDESKHMIFSCKSISNVGRAFGICDLFILTLYINFLLRDSAFSHKKSKHSATITHLSPFIYYEEKKNKFFRPPPKIVSRSPTRFSKLNFHLIEERVSV